MGSELAWFLVVAGSGAALVAAGGWAVSLEPKTDGAFPSPQALRGWALALAALIVWCLLLKIHAYDVIDDHVVAILAETRSASLVSVFTVVTTMGDVVPTLLIATALAIAFYQGRRAWGQALLLPAAVIVQVAIQFVIAKLFQDQTIAQLDPHLSIGGAGPIPSGSVARLFAVFLIAAYLWQGQAPAIAQRLRVTGYIVTLVELVSRLYLGRHFVSDIGGGLLLGVLLVSSFAWCIAYASGHRGRGARPSPKRDHASTNHGRRST